MGPGFNAARFQSIFGKDHGNEIMIVGHDQVSAPSSGLLTGGDVKLAKAGIARVEVENDGVTGRLIWLLPPKVATLAVRTSAVSVGASEQSWFFRRKKLRQRFFGNEDSRADVREFVERDHIPGLHPYAPEAGAAADSFLFSGVPVDVDWSAVSIPIGDLFPAQPDHARDDGIASDAVHRHDFSRRSVTLEDRAGREVIADLGRDEEGAERRAIASCIHRRCQTSRSIPESARRFFRAIPPPVPDRAR